MELKFYQQFNINTKSHMHKNVELKLDPFLSLKHMSSAFLQ